MLDNAHVPILGFAAWSGTGKTTLLRSLLPRLKAQGLAIALMKHAHHTFEIDTPGKDSYELRKAGADQVLVASRHRWALLVERSREHDPDLDEMLLEIDQGSLDLILVEGFKHERFPKIEVHRPALARPLLFPDDDSIIAVAADAPLGVECSLPLLDLNDHEALTRFIVAELPKLNPWPPRRVGSASLA